MKKRNWLSLFLVLVLGISLIAPVALAEDTIKIGGIAVLSGSAANYGQAVQKGVDLYISQLNEAGGINGKKVEVIWEDDQGDANVGVNAFNKLKDVDGVVAIIGAVISRVTSAVAEYAADSGIPMITASSTTYDITTGRPNVFRTCFLDSVQAIQMARFAKGEGYSKVAVMYDNGDEYSTGLYEEFVKAAKAQGLDVVKEVSASFSDVDFKSQLTTLKDSTPEAVFLPYYGNEASLILTQANEVGLNAIFLGADGIADIVEVISDKSLLTKMTYSDHFAPQSESEIAKKYVESYKAKYNEDPTISFAATGYDAALVLTEALKQGTDFKTVTAAISKTNIEGVSGMISFDDHNDPIKDVFVMTFNEKGEKQLVKVLNP